MKIQVCTGKSCSSKYSKYIIQRLENDTQFYKWKNITIESCCCMGKCKKGPNVMIGKQEHEYMNPAKISEIVRKQYK